MKLQQKSLQKDCLDILRLHKSSLILKAHLDDVLPEVVDQDPKVDVDGGQGQGEDRQKSGNPEPGFVEAKITVRVDVACLQIAKNEISEKNKFHKIGSC